MKVKIVDKFASLQQAVDMKSVTALSASDVCQLIAMGNKDLKMILKVLAASKGKSVYCLVNEIICEYIDKECANSEGDIEI